ncbi:SMP-30/gluconolactonase/LRE family protein [uncultured Bacteroides sp.]|uniref:SMP-30/gluconolactonase/LRE family protein n=1 Tax=uncultured Bacteroides sp. TaxID=162156 RepID=UPI0025E5913B|nr:SMP-30/gluconolactonase/LRE family protein [uncultured Bacteroides sp.]
MKTACLITGLCLLLLTGCNSADRTNKKLQASTLFIELPEYCPTPDGMAIAPDGNLILACPNFADQTMPACLMRITPDKRISKWIDVPVLPETGVACPMGIAFNEKGDLYVCDNQGWTGSEQGRGKGRLLKLIFDARGELQETVTVACNMEHPNGVRVHRGKVYVTQSSLSAIPSEKLVSGVYCFNEDDRDVEITNTLEDKNLLATVVTRNPQVQYGLDGIVFDKAGNLYVGNFGDGAIHKITLNKKGEVLSNAVWAQDSTQLTTTDGICMDEKGNMYVADFSVNTIARITPDGQITRIAQSPDCDGSNGGLDQPGEPIVWNGKLIVSCFDIVTGPDKVNTGHDKPYTLAQLELESE